MPTSVCGVNSSMAVHSCSSYTHTRYRFLLPGPVSPISHSRDCRVCVLEQEGPSHERLQTMGQARGTLAGFLKAEGLLSQAPSLSGKKKNHPAPCSQATSVTSRQPHALCPSPQPRHVPCIFPRVLLSSFHRLYRQEAGLEQIEATQLSGQSSQKAIEKT